MACAACMCHHHSPRRLHNNKARKCTEAVPSAPSEMEIGSLRWQEVLLQARMLIACLLCTMLADTMLTGSRAHLHCCWYRAGGRCSLLCV